MASVTVGFLVVGLLGITYSVMSTSWDEAPVDSEREGGGSGGGIGGLGVEEFNTNLDNVKRGLMRGRENSKLRERMDEVENVEMKELNRRMRRDRERDKGGEE